MRPDVTAASVEVDPHASVPILLVDDDSSKRMAIKAVLAPLGYSIVEADSGEAALRCVMARDFAVILLDVHMPELNGFQTAALIRRRKQSETTPIIFITAYVSDEIEPSSRYVEGAVDFIFAPVQPEELRAKVSVFAALFAKAEALATRARAVQASADQLRLLTDAAPIGIFQADAQGLFIYTNPRWSEITGISSRAAQGQEWAEIVGSERGRFTGRQGDGDSGEHSNSFELKVNGVDRIVSVTSEPIPDPRGNVIGWVGTLADVTAEVTADQELSESERRFRELADAMPQIVWSADVLGQTDYLNQRWFEYTGLSAEETESTGWASVLHPDDIDRCNQNIRESMETGSPIELESRMRRGVDGEYRWHLIRGLPVRDIRGDVTKWFGTCTDIDEQKDAAEALRTSERLFKSAFEAGRTGIALIAAEGGAYVDVNAALCQMLGYTREELLEMSWLQITHPDDRERNLAEVESLHASDSGVMYDIEKRYIRKDGEVISVELNDSIIRDESGSTMYTITHATDVTERNRVSAHNEQLETQLRQAQKMEAVGQLAGGIAHDFNNILAVVLNYAEFVSEGLEENDEARSDLAQIITAGERGAELVHQLLAFSRQEVIQPSSIDLNEVVGGMAMLLSRSVGEDVDLDIQTDTEVSLTKADHGQIEQILLNLVVNARDSMPGGGRIEIKTDDVELAPGERIGLEAGRYVCLTVADTGCGIDPDTLDRIFEPFFTTKERGKGTGLGLATVYGIVKQAGGGIYATSEVGVRTSFDMYLPVTDEEIPIPVVPVAVKGLDEATILVVEDEGPVRELIGRILRRAGFSVIDVGSGAEAVDICSNPGCEIDLLVTDVVMPEMSGPALRDLVLPLRPGMSVLFMSGYTDELISKRGVLEDGEALLNKPFNSIQLLTQVREALQRDAHPPIELEEVSL